MKKKSKNLLVLIVLLAIIGIAVGYAALSQTLTLNGTATLKSGEWDVHFVENSAVVTQNSVSYGDAEISLDDGNVSGTFTATMAPGETVIYEVDVINEGSIPATLADTGITVTGESDNISCAVTGPVGDATISDGGTHHYTITLTCADMDSLPSSDEVASVTVTFPYVQSTTTASN